MQGNYSVQDKHENKAVYLGWKKASTPLVTARELKKPLKSG